MTINNLSTNLGLPVTPEVKDGETFNALLMVHNAIGGLQSALDSYTSPIAKDSSAWSSYTPTDTLLTSNANRLYGKFTGAVAAGRMINIYNNAGAMEFRLADQGTNVPCRAFAPLAVAAGAYGEVIVMQGVLGGFAGLVPGTLFWLANTGLIQNTAPGAGLIQKVAFAMNTTTIYFAPELF